MSKNKTTKSGVPYISVSNADGTTTVRPLVNTNEPVQITEPGEATPLDPGLSLTKTKLDRDRSNLIPTDDPYHPLKLETGSTGMTRFRRKTD